MKIFVLGILFLNVAAPGIAFALLLRTKKEITEAVATVAVISVICSTCLAVTLILTK